MVKLELTIMQGFSLHEVKSIGTSKPYVSVACAGLLVAETPKVRCDKELNPRFNHFCQFDVDNWEVAQLRFTVMSDSEKVMGEAMVPVASIIPGAPAVNRFLELQRASKKETIQGKQKGGGSLQVTMSLPYLTGQEVLICDDSGEWVPASVIASTSNDRNRVTVLASGKDEPQTIDTGEVKPLHSQDRERVVASRLQTAAEREADLRDRSRAAERAAVAVAESSGRADILLSEAEGRAGAALGSVEWLDSREAELSRREQEMKELHDPLTSGGRELQQLAASLVASAKRLDALGVSVNSLGTKWAPPPKAMVQAAAMLSLAGNSAVFKRAAATPPPGDAGSTGSPTPAKGRWDQLAQRRADASGRASASPAGSPGASPSQSPRERMEAIFATYAPDKAGTVDRILSACAGREEAMIGKLVKKYGPEPEQPGDGGDECPPTVGHRGRESDGESCGKPPTDGGEDDWAPSG